MAEFVTKVTSFKMKGRPMRYLFRAFPVLEPEVEIGRVSQLIP
jgi:hypothetical protein